MGVRVLYVGSIGWGRGSRRRGVCGNSSNLAVIGEARALGGHVSRFLASKTSSNSLEVLSFLGCELSVLPGGFHLQGCSAAGRSGGQCGCGSGRCGGCGLYIEYWVVNGGASLRLNSSWSTVLVSHEHLVYVHHEALELCEVHQGVCSPLRHGSIKDRGFQSILIGIDDHAVGAVIGSEVHHLVECIIIFFYQGCLSNGPGHDSQRGLVTLIGIVPLSSKMVDKIDPI